MNPNEAAARAGDPLAKRKIRNSALLREEIAARKTRLQALPEVVTLNNTDLCNLRCIMCQRHEGQGSHSLDDGVIRQVGDELLPTAQKVVLTMAGGEPLGVGFETVLDCARRHRVRMDVMTNVMLMDERRFLAMRPLLDHLNVSVDCADPELYERIRIGASFDRLVERLTMVSAIRADGRDDMLFSLSAVVMASNLPHLAGLVRFAARYGADGVILQLLRHEVKATREEEPRRHFSPAEIARHLDAAERAARETGVNLITAHHGRSHVFVRPLRAKVPPPLEDVGICSFLTQNFSVMYTGEVYPCCKPTDYVLGDVRHQSAREIWNGERMQRLRRAHYARRRMLFCSGCEYAPHLPAARWPWLQERCRRARRFVGRWSTRFTRWRRADSPPSNPGEAPRCGT